MTTNNRVPELSRRKAMSAMAVGLIALPTAAHLVDESFAAGPVLDTAATLPSIETEPFLVTF